MITSISFGLSLDRPIQPLVVAQAYANCTGLLSFTGSCLFELVRKMLSQGLTAVTFNCFIS